MAKRRSNGKAMLRQRKDGRWEGSYYPRLPDGKRKKFNVYAKTKEECEVKLEEMIARKRAEIAAEKERLKAMQTA